MATTKPRLTITLEPHTHLVISTLAKLQGGSKSKVITDLLDSVVPVLERTARVLQMAEAAQTSVTQDMKTAFEDSEKKLEKMINQAMGEMETLEDFFSGEPVSEHAQPPYSNRGVRSKPTPHSDPETEVKNPESSTTSGRKKPKARKVSDH